MPQFRLRNAWIPKLVDGRLTLLQSIETNSIGNSIQFKNLVKALFQGHAMLLFYRKPFLTLFKDYINT